MKAVAELCIDFDAYFEFAPPTVIVRPDPPRFTIIAANDGYLKVTKSSWADLEGKGLLEAFPQNPKDATTTNNVASLRESLTKAVITKLPQELPSQKYDIPVRGTDQFETRYWKATNSPVLNKQGEVTCLMHVALDISEAIQIAQKERSALEMSEAQRKSLQQMEERLRLAVDSAKMGTWHIDLKNGNITTSLRFKELYGFNPDEQFSIDDLFNIVGDDYRYRVTSAIKAAIEYRKPLTIEFPIIGRHNQKLRWIRATGKHYEAEDSQPSNYSGTVMDITERKLDEIRKNDFIAMVSHELKTPLTSVKAYVQMLTGKLKNSGDNFSMVALQKVHVQIEKMHTLIKGFLDVARLEAGKIQLNLQNFVLSELLQQAVDEVEGLTKSHQFILDLCDSVTVNADKDKISQVVNNFLSNAIKYSPHGGLITISCAKHDGMVTVSVKDTGIGISKQDQERLFDRFYRVESADTRNISGFGIGLYLCAEIVERHNGHIGVFSEQGQGSTFYFSLPID
ncbi:ATP-binding protein [Mucilaginibacter sp. RS28]|uniref:histidine kinase n=1 Tax=Mucilaginibacter straminoryzae TaxID=2932774 RepID=A0A9X1X168_9SPHI|nr:ATP-binding protein [Mucilaginibacter straminoryzae]MCJ8208505.1 ATP-binding protein [Mucilaginibacter straminoryzae]